MVSDRTKRTITFIGILAIIVGIAVNVVLSRLSDEALAVLAGAVCGVGAAIPTSLLIVAVSRWREHRNEPLPPLPSSLPGAWYTARPGAYPPYPPTWPDYSQYPLLPPYREPYRPERPFTIVGGDGETGE